MNTCTHGKTPFRSFRRLLLVAGALAVASPLAAAPPEPTRQPLRQVIDLNIGEAQEIRLVGGAKATVRLVALAKDGYAVTTHRFARPGTYIVTVERENEFGQKAIGHLAVEVGK